VTVAPAEPHVHQEAPAAVLRIRIPGRHSPVTTFELFFDLVFVFAVTQLSHTLAAHLTFEGAFHTLLLMLAVWWVWVYTTWATNWCDPGHVAVRGVLIGVMLAGLIMSAAIPEAFDSRGMAFALPFAAIQVGRTAFVLWAVRGDASLFRSFQRIVAWLATSALFWLAGGVAEGHAREALWIAALTIEYLGPPTGYWFPRLGRSSTSEWTVEGGHMAERCGLFIIIALGESLLVTGATFSGLEWTVGTVGAMLAAFGAAVAMWWIYFDRTAEFASQVIGHADDPGRLARLAYTYLHLPLVAGIILAAVGDERALDHPTGDTNLAVALVILGGPALFLTGHWLFKRAVAGHFVSAHVIAVATLGVALAGYPLATPAQLSVVATGVLSGVAAWSVVAYRRAVAQPLTT
jgi:low temperature requirement protein LtrA